MTSHRPLELRYDEGGSPRYYLDGDPVLTGAPLELLILGDTWIRGRLEVEHDSPDPYGHDRRPLPVFYAAAGERTEIRIPVPPNAVLRRPTSSGAQSPTQTR